MKSNPELVQSQVSIVMQILLITSTLVVQGTIKYPGSPSICAIIPTNQSRIASREAIQLCYQSGSGRLVQMYQPKVVGSNPMENNIFPNL